VLNANGWAINAKSLVNVKFGKTLTSLANFPRLTAVDPAARKKAFWKGFCWVVICLALAGGLVYGICTGKLCKKKEAPAAQEQVEEVAEAAAEPAVELPETAE
jgi:hypothetical protein